MNAITMKLESIQPPAPPCKDKSKASFVPKTCKNNRKKSFVNTDKDALVNSHGLGRKSGDNVDPNYSKSKTSVECTSPKKPRSKKVSPKSNEKMPPKTEMLERLEQFLSPEIREKISSILNDVRSLSDVEKLFLYLQLPTGAALDVDPLKPKTQNPLGKKSDEEGMIAVTWIQSHFEEDPDVSLPKQEVYNEYQTYCQMTGTESLCAADFGKVMKQIFPSVKPRRLGTRGNSRYCYSGLRKKLKLAPPSLPDMQADEETDIPEEDVKDEATSAYCHILFEWVEKLLGTKFTCLKSLASHLLENMYVDNRSVAAFTVLLEGSSQLLEKGFSSSDSGLKKSLCQVNLQRKIQEKELIKEQKKKIQEQRSNLIALNKDKATPSKKKGLKSKKSKSPSTDSITFVTDKESDSLPTKSSDGSCEGVFSQEKVVFNIKEEKLELEPTTPLTILQQTSPEKSPENSSEMIEDSVKKNNTFFLPRSKTPVCIAQSLPNIIIVPQQLNEMGKHNAVSPKYKRIQPKPFSAAMRNRAGSVGSSVTKPKSKSVDGRRSSHAWLQSVCSPESGEEGTSLNIGNISSVANVKTTPPKSSLRKSNFVVPKEVASDKSSLTSENKPTAVIAKSQSFGKHIPELKSRPPILGSHSVDKCLPASESTTNKRPMDGSLEFVSSKRQHLDSGQAFKITQSILMPARNVEKACIATKNPFINSNTTCEEVSVHDIEGDALIDYLRGANPNVSIFTSLQQTQEKLESEQTALPCANKVNQLSQLRMLLEQNLPRRMTSVSEAEPHEELNISSDSLKSSILSTAQSSKTADLSGKKLLLYDNKMAPPINFENLCNIELVSLNIANDKLNSNTQSNSIARLLNFGDLNSQLTVSEQNELNNEILSNPGLFLNIQNTNKNENVQLDIASTTALVENDIMLSSNVIPDVGYVPNAISNVSHSGRVNTYTQVPSVPQSPNTRRRAFNFMPISPRHTPIPDNLANSTSSPIPNTYPRNMMSIAVGPSQPPSNSGSPFVSPRSTPVSMCRSRHSSGQSTYSTSRHTPFQNFDSGVSSISSSPFISPQPTPVPVSRLRHNSSHSSNKTVTFSSINNPQIIHSQNIGQLRSRHSSGHLPGNLRGTPLSPLVTDPPSSFVFPTSGNTSHHDSSSTATTPQSPVSEQTSSSSSCTSNLPDLTSVTDSSVLSHSFLNDGAADLLINGNQSNFRQIRQRHASSSLIYSKPNVVAKEFFSPEIQNLLKGVEDGSSIPNPMYGSNRSQSVPLHQMLQNLDGYYFLPQPLEEPPAKSQPTTPVMNQMFSFPLVNSVQDNSLVLSNDIQKSNQMEWMGLEGTSDLEMNSARRNLVSLLDNPLGDDLQTTLEDLRDCDTDFSKFAQELEFSQNDDGSLQYEVK